MSFIVMLNLTYYSSNNLGVFKTFSVVIFEGKTFFFFSQLFYKENQSNMKVFSPEQSKIISVSLCSPTYLPQPVSCHFQRVHEQMLAMAFVLRQCNSDSKCFNSTPYRVCENSSVCMVRKYGTKLSRI